MSDDGMPTGDELELRELERIRDENYSDLLDQMDEAWGHSGTIGRSEVNAFLESRIVHKPTTRLRARLAALEAASSTTTADDFCYAQGDEGAEFCGDPKSLHCSVLGDATFWNSVEGQQHLVRCMRDDHLIHHPFVSTAAKAVDQDSVNEEKDPSYSSVVVPQDSSESAARPRIVCLCGSTRFMEAFQDANLRETLAGRIVLSVGTNTKSDAELTRENYFNDPSIKERLDTLHFRKIDMADEILVIDVGGYIGESTRNEIEYATALGKPIKYLSEQPSTSSVLSNPEPGMSVRNEPESSEPSAQTAARQCAYAASNYFDSLYIASAQDRANGIGFTSAGVNVTELRKRFESVISKHTARDVDGERAVTAILNLVEGKSVQWDMACTRAAQEVRKLIPVGEPKPVVCPGCGHGKLLDDTGRCDVRVTYPDGDAGSCGCKCEFGEPKPDQKEGK